MKDNNSSISTNQPWLVLKRDLGKFLQGLLGIQTILCRMVCQHR